MTTFMQNSNIEKKLSCPRPNPKLTLRFKMLHFTAKLIHLFLPIDLVLIKSFTMCNAAMYM